MIHHEFTTYYLVSVWTNEDWTHGSTCEDFKTLAEAEQGILDLMKDHPNAVWKLIQGMEVKRL